MKRKAALGTGILTMVLCLAMGFTAYAQGWEQDGNGWWLSLIHIWKNCIGGNPV